MATLTGQLIIQQASISGAVRRDTSDGREFLVVPVVAVVQGVLNGELVPAAEIERSLPSWNGRPITVGHPENDSGYLSANDPAVLEDWGLGYLFRCHFDTDRLKGEMWLDLGKAERVGGELAAAVARFENNETTEVSTGYWREATPRRGVWNGREYTAVQSNLLPDHLAILLNDQGACNWSDGCGAPRVNTAGQSPCGCHKEKNPMKVTINVELSLDEQLSRVYEAFMDKFTRADGLMDVWPREVFSEVVIASNGTQLLAYPWTADGEGVITFDAPKVVEVVYQDVESGQSVIGNTAGRTKQAGVIQRLANALVAAVTGNAAVAVEEVEEQPETDGEIETVDDPEPAAGGNPPEIVDPGTAGEAEEIMSNAFTEMVERLGGVEAVERDILALRANNAAARQQRIARLTANARCAFSADELATFADDALDKLERSLSPVDYSGRALPRNNASEPDEEVMVMPSLSPNGAGK